LTLRMQYDKHCIIILFV